MGGFLIFCIQGRRGSSTLTGLSIRSPSGPDGAGGVRRRHHHNRPQLRERRRAGLPQHLRPAARQFRRAGRRCRRRRGAPPDQVRLRAPDSIVRVTRSREACLIFFTSCAGWAWCSPGGSRREGTTSSGDSMTLSKPTIHIACSMDLSVIKITQFLK